MADTISALSAVAAVTGAKRIASRGRILVLAGVACYAAVFNWLYCTYLYPTFGYLGFEINHPNSRLFLLVSGLAILPGVWLPAQLRRPSDLIYWVIFVTVYVPSLFVPAYVNFEPIQSIAALAVTMFGGLALLGLGTRLPRMYIQRRRLSQLTYWGVVLGLGLFLLWYTVRIYQGHFRLVAIGEIYDEIRFSGGALSEGNLVNYAIMLLGGAINPFLICHGLVHRKMVSAVVGALGQVLLYSTAGQKVYLLSIVILPMIYYGLLKARARSFGPRFVFALTFLCVGLNFFRLVPVPSTQALAATPASLLFMRTMGIPGLLTARYSEFFLNHPYTHYSHVRGINWLITYPYERDIGRTIGFYYSDDENLNANAHFWCMDGLAAWGLVGIPIASVLCAVVFWLIDSAARWGNPEFGAMLGILPAMMLTNTSLFTTIWSGGLGLAIILLFFFPTSPRASVMKESPTRAVP